MDLETMDQAADTGGPFVIINIAADSAEVGSQVRILSRYLGIMCRYLAADIAALYVQMVSVCLSVV